MLSLAAQGAKHYRFWELRGYGFARVEANTRCDWHPKGETYTVLGCKFARANEHSGLAQLILWVVGAHLSPRRHARISR